MCWRDNLSEVNLQPVSFLISSISSSLSNVEALDPMVKCFYSGLSQPQQLWQISPFAPRMELANKLTSRAKLLRSRSVRSGVRGEAKPIQRTTLCVSWGFGLVESPSVRSSSPQWVFSWYQSRFRSTCGSSSCVKKGAGTFPLATSLARLHIFGWRSFLPD